MRHPDRDDWRAPTGELGPAIRAKERRSGCFGGSIGRTRICRAWRRFVAHLIDGILCLFAYLIIGSMVAARTGGMIDDGFYLQGTPALVAILLTFLVTLGYFAVLESSGSGKTLGKLIAGIGVADASGGKATFSQALMRNILRLVDGLVFYIVGIILILNSDKNQRLGDRVAGTVVLRTHTGQESDSEKNRSPASSSRWAAIRISSIDDDGRVPER
jgi:uncharacterized RDD family membrane protein YckC